MTTLNNNNCNNFGRELLLSLPAMEQEDLLQCQHHLQQLHLCNDDDRRAYDTRACTLPTAHSSELARAIATRIQDYQKLYSDKSGVTARYTLTEPTVDQCILHTYAELVDSANHRTGYWAAEWTIQRRSDTEADLEGALSLHVCYSEDGTVHTRCRRTLERQTLSTAEEKVHAMVAKMEHHAMSYDEKLSRKIVGQITLYERTLYEDVTNVFEQMDASFKKIRGILPITKTRFKWDAAAQKQVVLLNARRAW